MNRLAPSRPLLLTLLLALGFGHAAYSAEPAPAAPPTEKAAADADRLSSDERRIAAGLFLDTPLTAGSIARSLDVLSGLRRHYGLNGGVRDDEEAARRAIDEIQALTFTPQDRARMAERLGVSLVPAQCAAACEQFETMVLLKLRMEALEKLALPTGTPSPSLETDCR